MNAQGANPGSAPVLPPSGTPAEILPAECACLLQNPALLRAALEFNGVYAPPDWGTASLSDAGLGRFHALLADHPRFWRFFPAPAQRTAAWCFEPAPNRLALLPPPLLERLGLYWSAAVWAEDLSRIIEKARLHEVMEQIGPEVYRYAVRRGRFQLGKLRPSLHPEAKHPEGASVKWTGWRAKIFRRPGDEVLALCLALWPEALRAAWAERWRQPLPKNPARQDELPFPTLWFWLEKILCTEVAPEWRPCFSS
jgi:hypothetical protein